MNKQIISSSIFLTSLLFLSACGSLNGIANTNSASEIENTQALGLAYENIFDIGAAVNRNIVSGNDDKSAAIVKQHFNSLTAENDMKWEQIQPTEGTFTFTAADALVNFAKSHNKRLIGHVLVWHEQTPNWVFEDENGNPASRERLLARMKSQIFALAGRYKDDIQGWDVVNEALNEDGSMRDSKWRQIIGDDFIEKAFEFASQAAPNAALYYNDYNLFKPEKMTGAIALAKRLQDKGIRIDGIGAQGHYGLPPPVEALEKSIQRVAQLGLKVMITELDISVIKFPDSENMGADISLSFALQESYNPYANGMSEEGKQRLAKAYTDVFAMLVKNHKHIDRVTLWGVTDTDTWRNNWPMKGRTDYPLLFDRDYKAKPFVFDLIDIAQAANASK